MNRKYSKENKKDKFIMDTLLPYLIDHIEESKNHDVTAKQAASMYIFPYRTEAGTRIGSMKEPGVSWYYTKEVGENIQSSGSYRIFDDSVLKEGHAVKFRQTFGQYSNIAVFSDAAVIMDLIEKMSMETEYTELWWTCAYDVISLWDENEFNSSLKKATENMENKSFLFLEGYCSEKIKQQLIKYEVFENIITTTSKQSFWDKLTLCSEREDAIKILKKMGVPYSFTDGENVNSCILEFIENIASEVIFPVNKNSDEFEKCDLCHSILLDKIFKENAEVFSDVVNDEDYNSGLVIKNIKNEFVPLDWDLFYLNKEIQSEDEEFEEEFCEDETVQITENELEHLHVDKSLYVENILKEVKTIHEFSDVTETLDEYNLGVNVESIEFYRWLWNYSQHEKLAENILYYFTDDDGERDTVPEEYTDFVLTVFKKEEISDKGYLFDIDLDVDQAFDSAKIVNNISRKFEDIYCVNYGDFSLFDTKEYLPLLVAAISSSSEIKAQIAAECIWDHVYLVDGAINEYDDTYVRGKKYDNGYEDVLLLWVSEDKDSYVRAMAKFIEESYDTEVAIKATESFDWKAEYFRLAKDIKEFVTEKRDIKSIDDISGFVANMNDVKNFGEEKLIWDKLKARRQKIVSQSVGKAPIDLSNWRSFLAAKYKGRCQLCGGKTITGEQNAHFFTYRISKESENQLANLSSNMFCLCPSCHGEMGYGSYMGKDMSELFDKAELYTEYIEQKILSGEMEDEFSCLVEELVNENDEIEGFNRPIVCNVVINGKSRNMAFSWEHFMKIAFILGDSGGQDVNEE